MQHELSHQYIPGTTATFFGQVMSYFALAILSSAIGTYVGFQFALQYIVAMPALMYIIFAAELILIFTAKIWSRKHPLGYVLFALFTFLSGLTLAPLLAVTIQEFGGAMVYKALAATAMTFIATGLIGWRTSWNLSSFGGFLFVALIGMIIVSLIGIFVPWNNTFEMIFSGIGIVVFSGFIMYDFQKIKHQQYAHPMDAALNIYLDIFNLFIYILRIMRALNRN